MKKKVIALMGAIALTFGMTACGSGAGSKETTWNVAEEFSYTEIAEWKGMQTPTEGSGTGSVAEKNDTDGFVTIKAADDGWGGLESGYIEIDLSKDPILFAQIFENPDGYVWGMKIVPENPIEDHEWGLYVIPDNNLKWNKYAGVDLKSVLGDDFVAIYGEKSKVKIWLYAAGGPEGTVSVSNILLVNTK